MPNICKKIVLVALLLPALKPLEVCAMKGNEGNSDMFAKIGQFFFDRFGTDFQRLTFYAKNGQFGQIRYLVEVWKANVNGKYDMWAPLHHASWGGHLEIVKYLIEKGATVDLKEDFFGVVALNLAATKGELEIAKYLVEKGADVNKANDVGETALMRAAAYGQLEIVKHLIEKGAKIDQLGKNNWTALHYAAQAGHIPIIDYLFVMGANINAKNGFGSTALSLAFEHKHHDAAKYLIEMGADFTITNREGLTSQDIAGKKFAPFFKLAEDWRALAKNGVESSQTVTNFVDRYLSTQSRIDKNLKTIIGFVRGPYDILEKLFTVMLFAKGSFLAAGLPIVAENLGKNAGHLELLHLAILANNAALMQNIIARNFELWNIMGAIFFKNTMTSLTNTNEKDRADALIGALSKSDTRFKKRFHRYMEIVLTLDGEHQKDTGTLIPREVASHILGYLGVC